MHRKVFVLCWLAFLVPAAIDARSGSERVVLPVAPGDPGILAVAGARDGEALNRLDNADARTDCPELDLPVPEDSTWGWRLRAYRYLDCVTAIVDGALGETAASSKASNVESGKESSEETVSMSRAELDRIRKLAWWARDAAARIGN